MNFPTKDSAIQKILQLVERFHEQKESYHRVDYNETLTRRDFIDPFFKALGWDVDNEHGFAESYREVIHEDRVKVGAATKAPDYSFRLSGGKRLFFVEAKKPSVLIKDDITPAYQVRRYGWSAKLPISIITDFEEFAIYDCTKKPNPTDKASNGRLKYLTYSNYLNEFDFIWDTFSKERVLKGSFDKFIQSDKHKKGTTTVDHEFLQSLDSWRTFLANNIALRNNIDEDELNFIVQHIIDRIIFLRIAEDRSVENYGNLKDTLKGDDYYQNLLRQFHTADQKYNSGLFDFKKDKISNNIAIDNKIIKSIINDLYYPLSPYEFSVLSVEILGSAYEQFLGKTITLSKTGKALIEEKPEVRKAGGVYYTPEYIVEYIVNNTVGKLTEGKTPKEISKLKIVDPACGSGSFLIGAYQFLLNWHKDYYSNNGKPSKGGKENPLTPDGSLTTAEKKRILLNNIYGVDLDANAVEVTKLSLLLKCMEGETEASIATQLRLFHERILPTLDDNIKCGNSLIDVDFYNTEFDFGEERKIKPFSWKKAFPEVFKNEGFDCAIGNPPYVAIEGIGQLERDYYNFKYPLLKKRLDLFGLFIDNGINLLSTGGKLSFIIPMQFLRNSSFEDLRKSILEINFIEEINYVGDKVFQDAKNDTIIITIAKKSEGKKNTKLKESSTTKTSVILEKETVINQRDFLRNAEFTIDLSSAESKKISQKIEINKSKINERFKITQGIVSGLNGAYIYHKNEIPNLEKKILRKFAFGSDFDRYNLKNPEYSIIYLNKNIVIKDYPETEKVLKVFKSQLEKRREVQKNVIPWYSLQWPRDQKLFESPKIIFQKIRNQKLKQRLVGTYDESGLYVGDGVIFLNSMTDDKEELKFVLAILNSSLYNYYYREQFLDINLKIKYIETTSIVDYTKFKKDEQKSYQEAIGLVDKLLILNVEKQQATLQTKIDQLQSRIDFCEQRINEIVYELYDLTEDEIKLIEKSSQ